MNKSAHPRKRYALAMALFCVAAVAQAAGFRLGTNLDAVTDYSPAMPFLDVFKQGREWYTANAGSFDTGEAARLDTDANGWLRSLAPKDGGTASYDRACTLIFSMGAANGGPQAGRLPYPAGKYTVLYAGAGTLEYSLAARLDAAASGPGRDIIDVTPLEPGIQICVTATRADNPLRDIRVYPPGAEALAGTTSFNPAYLARLKPFAVLRFMDWMRTNDSSQGAAADRPALGDYVYSTARGVPAEVMVDLANALSAEPWFNMPQAASDAYVAAFAAVVKTRLAAGRAVYVEYSNEIWNNQFSQGAAIEAEGVARFGAKTGSDFDRRLNRYGERAAEICQLWRTAFAGETERVRCVMAGQAANSYIAETALDCPMSQLAPCQNQGMRGIAIAPYFGDWIGLEQHLAATTGWAREADGGLTRLFAELENGRELNDAESGGGMATIRARIASHAALASAKGVELLAYEGGQHLVGVGAAAGNATLDGLFDAANRDSRMGAFYASYLDAWKTGGGGLFMHFSDFGTVSRFGRWGALELATQTASPKYDALVAAATDCLFDWAEGRFPTLFAPAGATTAASDPYSYRAYAATGNYLGVSAADGHVWVLGPAFGGQPADVGDLAEHLRTAGCR